MAFRVTGPDFAAALYEQLLVRPGLSAVPVLLVAPLTGIDREDAIIVVRERIPEELSWAALGRRRQDSTGTIPGVVRAWRTPDSAGSQDSIVIYRAAATRAAALLDEVVSQVTQDPPNVGDQTIEAHVTNVAWVPMMDVDYSGWFMDCEFSVTYRARVS